MKESKLNNRVSEILKEFEGLEDIRLSSGWRQSLDRKLSSSKPGSEQSYTGAKFSVLITFFVLINVGFVAKMLIGDYLPSHHRGAELKMISKDLLFNPTLINN